MNANELLKKWPGWANANAARVLASPAWRLETRFAGKPAVLTRDLGGSGEVPSSRISLSVTQDGAPGVLTFAPSPLMPDLWLLRDRLDALPREVLLALVERECGPLFQFFEDVGRQSFAVSGLADSPSTGLAFRLAAEGGEIRYAIDVPASVEQAFGQIANLDAAHESIRAMTRDVTACHAALDLSDDEAAALAPGDCLMLPSGSEGSWLLEIPSDDRVRLVTPEPRTATFAEIADEALGSVALPDRVNVIRHGALLATGTISNVGMSPALKILSLH